jgi:hypothetical protein
LTSDRPYRRALSVEDALQIIEKRRGTMYEPAIVDVFREMCVDTATPAVVDFSRKDQSSRAESAHPIHDEVAIATSFGVALARRLHDACPWRTLAEELSGLPLVDTVVVFVQDATDRLIPLRVAGKHAQTLERLSIPVGERMSGWVAAVGEPMLNGDAALDLFDTGPASLQSAAAIPCRGPGDLRAVVSLYSTRPEAFSSLHERLVDAAMGVLGNPRDRVPALAKVRRFSQTRADRAAMRRRHS